MLSTLKAVQEQLTIVQKKVEELEAKQSHSQVVVDSSSMVYNVLFNLIFFLIYIIHYHLIILNIHLIFLYGIQLEN